MDSNDQSKLEPVAFHFFKIKFTPYNQNREDTNEDILRAVITYLQQLQTKGQGILIDKHEEREKSSPRFLFVPDTSFDHKQKRIKCSMALLRTGAGRTRLKPYENYALVPLDQSKGQIAELTHFFIDFNSRELALCVEFNANGPRASDIEYYFRVIARDKVNKAKGIDLELIMDVSIEKALSEMKNVLSFKIKVEPLKLNALDTELKNLYFSGLSTFADKVKPKYIKLFASFTSPDKKLNNVEVNKDANTMTRRFLNFFKAKESNSEVFNSFVVNYSNSEGEEISFDLLKGKKEVIKYVNLEIPLKTREWHDLINDDFTTFVNTLPSNAR